ncbi:DUF1439 domain-containing protein [Collimonas fungivorans]|uniref:DUF1439 domain-containing protein n=1 Tax=Collimonas fungivorans (strain Ter331) TaxID=1005048 RepID=G0AI92_COLFT|nr:DUF1439 domain-containing protein [Collimonas fungivorans]AEK60675.1 hypothetical protein CFU_0841 [Collimonas fungivorans Ter331]
MQMKNYVPVTKTPVLLVLLATLLLSSCAALIGPRDVEFPLTKLQQSVDKRLPFSQRYLGLFEITANKAQLSLPPEQNRLAMTTDVILTMPLLGKSWSGKMAISGVLFLDNPHNAVTLQEPKLDSLVLDGLDNTYAAQVTQIGNLLTHQLLTNLPLYTFKPEDLRYAGVAFMPTKIGTRAENLVVTFEPVK